MFKINDNKGFQVTFENGLTLSTQFGWANYCENRVSLPASSPRPAECENAEVAVIGEDGVWYTRAIFGALGEEICGDVVGWIGADRWADLVDIVRCWVPLNLKRYNPAPNGVPLLEQEVSSQC